MGDLDGDGIGDLAVGARYDDDGYSQCGALWVLFLHQDGTVKSEQKISATAGGFGGILTDWVYFGASVASLGDLDGDGVADLAVGADGTDDGGSARGAVWILFLNPDGTVRTEQKISDTTGGFGGILENGDLLGTAVEFLEDIDGNGTVELAVGAPTHEDGGPRHGATWILYMNPDGTVQSEQKINDTAGGFLEPLSDEDRFGSSLASRDFGPGARVTLLVGTPGAGGPGANRGALWFLQTELDGTVALQRRIGDCENGFFGPLDDQDGFGASVEILGDLDADGRVDLAAGSPGDDDGGTDRGAVWILYHAGAGFVSGSQKISATTGGFAGTLDDGDFFGCSIAHLGDLDGNGIDDLAVGASGDDDGGTDRGAVWILHLGLGGVVESEVKISDTAGGFGGLLGDGDGFGAALGNLGDFNADGTADLAVGVPGDDTGGADRGAVWILFLEPSGAVQSEKKITDGIGGFFGSLDDGDRFGTSVTHLGNEVGDLAVGSPGDDDGGLDRGAVWILDLLTSGDVVAHAKISSTTGGFTGALDDGDDFGCAVASPGDVDQDGFGDLVVGADLDDDGGSDRGATWVLFCDGVHPPSAEANWRNGSGVNPDVFLSTSRPILGTVWTSTVDGGSIGASGLVLVVGYSGMLAGTMTPWGELLIDPASSLLFTSTAALGGTGISDHSVLVPSDPALAGERVFTQALLVNVGGAALLTNAWFLVVGY